MLGRSRPLRAGLRRPLPLRFDSPLGGRRSPFGDGHYSGNIVQDGVVLQPQDYLLDGVTPMPRCIVITGPATVAPDATTGAAVWTARNVVLTGATASLSASTNCKGLLGFVSGCVALRNGAHAHMDRLGKAGNFGDLPPSMLLPTYLASHVSLTKLQAYAVKARGAEGGERTASGDYPANAGRAAGAMQTGGGGGGHGSANHNVGAYVSGGKGGCGGPCCGGAAASHGRDAWNGQDAGDYGGPGGNAIGDTSWYSQSRAAAGGGGDPTGADVGAVSFRAQAGGGLFFLFAATFDNASGCITSADGSPGGISTGAAENTPGPAPGGGCVVIVTKPGGYTNNGTVRAAGGVAQNNSGNGGPGSVNIFELAA